MVPIWWEWQGADTQDSYRISPRACGQQVPLPVLKLRSASLQGLYALEQH